MANYPFAKDFTCWFYPHLGQDALTDLLTAQNPAIYVFRDTMPSLADAAAGTGAVNEGSPVTSWTWDAGRGGFSFTVPALADPDPTSTVRTRTYWLAVNLVLQTSGAVQTVLRSIEVERVTGLDQTVLVTDADLRAAFPQLDGCSDEAGRAQHTSLAISEVKARLKTQGYRWHQIHNLDGLKNAVVYKVLSAICLSQVQQPNDKWYLKYREFKDSFTSTLDGLALEYDSNGDGKPDVAAPPSSGTMWVVR